MKNNYSKRLMDVLEYSREEAAEINALDAANAYRFGFQAIQSLVNKAEVTDNRIRFY